MIRRVGSRFGLIVFATIGVAGFLCPATSANAQYPGSPHSVDDVVRLMHQNGLTPFSAPRRRGAVYDVDASDARGEPTHVVIDALTGDLLWRTHRGVRVPDIASRVERAPLPRRVDPRQAHDLRERPQRRALAALEEHGKLRPKLVQRTPPIIGVVRSPSKGTMALRTSPAASTIPIRGPDPVAPQNPSVLVGYPAATAVKMKPRTPVAVAPLE